MNFQFALSIFFMMAAVFTMVKYVLIPVFFPGDTARDEEIAARTLEKKEYLDTLKAKNASLAEEISVTKDVANTSESVASKESTLEELNNQLDA